MSSVADDIQELVKTHRVWLRRVIAARTGSHDAVEEVYSETLLAVTKSDQRPTDEAQVAPWMCKIAVRQSALYQRKSYRQQKLVEGYAHQQQPTSEDEEDPIFWLLDQERRDLVRQALGEMEPEARNILIMKFVERLTYNQIGERLGVAPHVAEYRIARGKKQLRTLVTQRGVTEEDLS